jgi:hypothetical protein
MTVKNSVTPIAAPKHDMSVVLLVKGIFYSYPQLCFKEFFIPLIFWTNKLVCFQLRLIFSNKDRAYLSEIPQGAKI